MAYKFEMYFNEQWNDISAYVETNATIGDRLDKTFNISSFVIPHIKADKFGGIDLSKPLKPWIPVKITIESDVFRFYTADCTRDMIKKTDPKLYRHNVQLVEVTKILQRKTIADTTVTQPKSGIFSAAYISDYKTLSKETIQNTEVSPNLSLIVNSKNTDFVDGNVLKANHPGKLFIQLDLENNQWNREATGFSIDDYWYDHNYYSGEATISVGIYINDVLTTEQTFDISATTSHLTGTIFNVFGGRDVVADKPISRTVSTTYDIPADTVDQTVTVKLKTLGTWDWLNLKRLTYEYYEDTLSVSTSFSLGAGEEESETYIYLNELAAKCIRSLNARDINDTDTSNDYRLDPVIYDRLKGKRYLAPEFTFTNYKAWDALEKIANTQNAVPEIKDDFRTITFRYLDNIPDMYYDQDMFYDETLAYSSNEYVDGLELNTSNLVEEDVLLNAKVEPYEGGWGSVRTSDTLVGQLTDDNAVFKTRQLIQKIYKFYIKGVGVKVTNGVDPDKVFYGNLPGVDPESTDNYWDISHRVVTDNEWNVYPDVTYNKSDGERTANRTKGNHIYYTQGSNLIQGLGHKTLTTSDFFGSKIAARTLFETIMTTAAKYLQDTDNGFSGWSVYKDSTTFDTNPEEGSITTGPHDNYDDILFRIEYVPLTVARSTIYKHDSFTSDSFLTDYVNEQDKLNDTENLGKYVLTTLNRQGNLQYSVSGKTRNYGTIPKLGYRTYNDLVVSSRDLNLNKNLINYTLYLSKDFINQSDYISRNSQYRAFEIPNTDIVHRQDKYTNFIVLTKNIGNVLPKGYNIMSEYGNKLFTQNFCDLIGSTSAPASYAKVNVVQQEGSDSISFDMPVNAYTIGTTVNLQTEFETNYSAGAKITDETIYIHTDLVTTTEDIKLQEYVQYTNDFGQIYSIETIMYPQGYVNNTVSDAESYPEFDLAPNSNTDILTLNMVVEKDAREKYGLNIEFPFITDDSSSLRAFSGIAKYNGLVRRKDDVTVSFALLTSDYFPSVNQKVLDIDKVLPIEGKIGTSWYDSENEIYGINFVDVPIPADTRYNGYVLYEEETKELIYAVKEDIAPYSYIRNYTTDKVWFILKKNLKDYTRPLE